MPQRLQTTYWVRYRPPGTSPSHESCVSYASATARGIACISIVAFGGELLELGVAEGSVPVAEDGQALQERLPPKHDTL
jgi:hypothetical protein